MFLGLCWWWQVECSKVLNPKVMLLRMISFGHEQVENQHYNIRVEMHPLIFHWWIMNIMMDLLPNHSLLPFQWFFLSLDLSPSLRIETDHFYYFQQTTGTSYVYHHPSYGGLMSAFGFQTMVWIRDIYRLNVKKPKIKNKMVTKEGLNFLFLVFEN